jgi:hypothetical protein
MLGIRGEKISPCSVDIEETVKARFRGHWRLIVSKASARKRIKSNISSSIENRQEAMGAEVFVVQQAAVQKKAAGRSAACSSQSSIMGYATARAPVATANVRPRVGAPEGQVAIDDAMENLAQRDIRLSNAVRLTTAIADFGHCDGLPFRTFESPLFKKVLYYARLVGKDYKPPNRNEVGGALLTINHRATSEANEAALKKDGKTFGYSFLGDGATIHRMPLINILCMSGTTPPTVLGIRDCTEHMQAGGKKDAPYIAEMFDKYVERLDPGKHQGLTDLFFFDGASNVQKAGRILAITCKTAHCLHGAEHVISLFFSDLAKLPQIKVSTFISDILHERAYTNV